MRLNQPALCCRLPHTTTVVVQRHDEVEYVIGLRRHLPKDNPRSVPCSPFDQLLAVKAPNTWDGSHAVLSHVMGIQLLLAVQSPEGGCH